MSKLSVPIGNDYCPQTLFLYGTYKENGEPNFGCSAGLAIAGTIILA